MTATREAFPRLAAPAPAQGVAPLVAAVRSKATATAFGLKGAERGYLIGRMLAEGMGRVVAIAADEDAADRLAADIAFFLGGEGTTAEPRVLRVPADDVLPYEEVSPNASTVSERLSALYRLHRSPPSLRAVVVSARTLVRRQVPLARFERLADGVKPGQTLERDEFALQLVDMGYARSPLVEDPGAFSVRGGLIDVWSPTQDGPVRIELFGDVVESLKAFDPKTQRTIEPIAALTLCPARELLFTEEGKKSARAAAQEAGDAVNRPSSKTRELIEAIVRGVPAPGIDALFPSLFPEGLSTLGEFLDRKGRAPWVYVDDPESVQQALADHWAELEKAFAHARSQAEIALEPKAYALSPEHAFDSLAGLGRLDAHAGGGGAVALTIEPTARLRDEISTHHGEDGALAPLVDRLRTWRDQGIAVAIACGTGGAVDKLKRLLLDRNTMVRVQPGPLPEDPAKLFDPSIWAHLFAGEITAGFVDLPGRFAVVSDEEIFGARQRKRRSTRSADHPFVEDFKELSERDLIVHVDFGVGRYLGLVKKTLANIPGDFLLLEYAGGDKVYLPVHRLRQVQKFVGADAETIKLDRLGGGGWERTKKRVKEELLKMAGELLKLYAARQAHPGFVFSGPDKYYRQFEADFEFETTPDQQKAIDDVLGDMRHGKPMDRLVCGDVGYGKTEVALRAAFQAVLDKKQVAVLVPTTVLAAQHLINFTKRFAGYPVRVEAVSRMRSADEVRGVIRRAALGQVDIVIGTHRLLAKDVAFKDLGLVVVDEEQRFGVKHKEALKQLRTSVDVLTLTATPIPRTLHMSMAGVRDLSIIATPPVDRKSIRTIVLKFDEAVIAEAIRREMTRGGQVYFVHNRVDSMAAMEKTLLELVPEARVRTAHGQMGEGELEEVMTAFVERKFDVLVCSSIIESGLDIPNANTILVNRADTFGLAQLYQIRGRVGRSPQRAYAYLFIPKETRVTPDAMRRLEVLQQYTELGAGFSIASHDLEIRGAGNLLGPDQSGAIAAVGFDLYSQLLEEAVAEMRGETLREDVDPDVTLPLAAYIPDDYVSDVHQRLVLYKRFSQVTHDGELSDLRAEMVDRFGELPVEVDHLTEVMLLKLELRALRLRALEHGPGRLIFTLGQSAALDPSKMATFIHMAKGRYKLTPDMKLVANVDAKLEGPDLIEAARKALRDLRKHAMVAA